MQGVVGGFDGLDDLGLLDREQRRIAALDPPLWHPPETGLVAAGVFVAFARGEQGPGHAGDRAIVGAAAVRDLCEIAGVVVSARAPAPYVAGYLAAREGAMLEAAVVALLARGVDPDVVVVDATGRDHSRRCGLAVHLGAVLDIPTIGVTHRPLRASGTEPGPERGAWSDLSIDGEVVGRWTRTRRGARAAVAPAGDRTDPATAVEVVLRVTAAARTPEPLRRARMVAREERSRRGSGGVEHRSG